MRTDQMSRDGVAAGVSQANNNAMPKPIRPSGWRKATLMQSETDRLAQMGEAIDVPKSRALVAVKRVARHIGLKAGDLLLLDTLGAFSQTQDWQPGQRAIVWPSNAYLMDQTGFSLSALKRHARRLAALGLIAFRDSPNGKRWGKRTHDGVIAEAYGFDLSPLAARAEEFESLHAQIRAEREICQRLKRQITVARRMIRAQIDALCDANGPLVTAFENLVAQLPRKAVDSEALENLLARFHTLRLQIEQVCYGAPQTENTETVASARCQMHQEMAPSEATSDPHILTTNQHNSVISNDSENVAPISQSEIPKSTALNMRIVLQACPQFTNWAKTLGACLRDWGDVYRIAGKLGPMIGVSERVWSGAQDKLGKHTATAALALVFDKHATGEVASPAGYLRGMVNKGQFGQLHLERSIYGRLKGHAG